MIVVVMVMTMTVIVIDKTVFSLVSNGRVVVVKYLAVRKNRQVVV